MQNTVRSPGTEEADNPLPLPNKGCCRPRQLLLSALFLTRKLRWGRGGPWVSTKALGSHAVTLRCPCQVLPCGRPQNLPPALGQLEPRPQPARRALCAAPRADLGRGCSTRSGRRAEQAFRSPLPRSAAAFCWQRDRMASSVLAAMFGSPPGVPTTKGSPRPCQEPGRPPLAGGGPVATQEAPCPEALSPSPLGPRCRPALPLPGTPSLTGGWADAQRASLLRPQLSLEKQRLPFCEGQTRLPNHEDGEIRAFIDGGNIQTPRLGTRARQGPRPGCVLPLGAPGGELLLQLLPRAFIHLLKLIQRICKRRRQQKKGEV